MKGGRKDSEGQLAHVLIASRCVGEVQQGSIRAQASISAPPNYYLRYLHALERVFKKQVVK